MKMQSCCPWCTKINDGVTGLGESDLPSEGDTTICFTCGNWSVFGEALVLRKPTDEEWAEIAQLDEVKQTTAIWYKVNGGPSGH